MFTLFLDDYERFFLWVPVLLGIGIGCYFLLPVEPPFWMALTLPCVALFLFPLSRYLFYGFFLIALGFLSIKIRQVLLDTPMLSEKTESLWLEGEVVSSEEKTTKKMKTYDRIVMRYNDSLVRLNLKGQHVFLNPGDTIRIKAVLMPFKGPYIPGGFDFRRQAYFQGLSATGYALSKVEILQKKDEGSFRHHLTRRIQNALPFPESSIASALITGEKSAIPESVRQAYSNAGIAHVLAISGLHLSIIAGCVFLLIRRGLCLFHSWPTKKIAAFATILVTFLYLGLSGFGIPAQRAFLMTSVVMVAVLTDRFAVSLRLVAIAATIILVFLPESLVSPSFQLSFAAVFALVVFYEKFSFPLRQWASEGSPIVRWGMVVVGSSLVSTLIATVATAPYTIAFFNQFSLAGVVANLIAIPLTTFVVMPLALLFTVFLILGIETYIVPFFTQSLHLLSLIADYFSSVALFSVPQPHMTFIPLLTLSVLWMTLWTSKVRWAGILPFVGSFYFLFFPNHPDVFVAENIQAQRVEDILYVSSKRAGRFMVQGWARALGIEKILKKPFAINKAFDFSEGTYFMWSSFPGFVKTERSIQGERPWTARINAHEGHY